MLIGGVADDPLRVSPYSDALERSLARVLSPQASDLVGGLRAVNTLRDWVQQTQASVPSLKRLGLPGLTGRSGHNICMDMLIYLFCVVSRGWCVDWSSMFSYLYVCCIVL